MNNRGAQTTDPCLDIGHPLELIWVNIYHPAAADCGRGCNGQILDLKNTVND